MRQAKRETLKAAMVAIANGTATMEHHATMEGYTTMASLNGGMKRGTVRLSRLSSSYRVMAETDKANRQALHLLGSGNGSIVPLPSKAIISRLSRFGVTLYHID